MKFKFTVMIFCTLLCSCSGAWHLRRAVHKSPELFQDTLRTEKITVKREVRTIEGPSADTVFVNNLIVDTVEIVKDNVRIRYFSKNDTVFVSADCPDSSIEIVEKIIEKEKIVKVVYKPGIKDAIRFFSSNWYWVMGFVILILGIVAVVKFLI